MSLMRAFPQTMRLSCFGGCASGTVRRSSPGLYYTVPPVPCIPNVVSERTDGLLHSWIAPRFDYFINTAIWIESLILRLAFEWRKCDGFALAVDRHWTVWRRTHTRTGVISLIIRWFKTNASWIFFCRVSHVLATVEKIFPKAFGHSFTPSKSEFRLRLGYGLGASQSWAFVSKNGVLRSL